MIVIKLGGAALKSSLSDPALFKALASSEKPFVVVHGGGPEINKLSELMGIEAHFVEGQRVTTPQSVEIVEMVLAGKINPALVRGLAVHGRRALGMSGVSCGLLECGVEDEKLGRVGRVDRVNVDLLRLVLDQGVTPVVAPVGVFSKTTPFAGSAANVNADLAAAKIATALGATQLLFLTDRDGILDSAGDVVSELSAKSLREMLASSSISGGMKVKARAILETLEQVPTCRIEVMNGIDPDVLSAALEGRSSGTVVRG